MPEYRGNRLSSCRYNVGGIAGRQSGYLHDCENRGAVYGRKDVGGVVGQMEPYLILKFGKDDLERLSDAFSGLQDIMDGMLDHTETTMDDVSFRLDNISAMSDEARESTDYLVHRTEDYVDDTIETVNDLSARADRFLGDRKIFWAPGRMLLMISQMQWISSINL